MSKYLLAICYPDEFPGIISTAARSMEEAETRFMHSISEDFNLDVSSDWDEFVDRAASADILIGEINSIEEFE